MINKVINNSKFYWKFQICLLVPMIFGFYLENGIQAGEANSGLLMWALVHLEQRLVLMK